MESANALTINEYSDIAAGIAEFGASSPLITWSNLFAPGTTWSGGSLGPSAGFGTQTATDPVTGTVVTSPPDGIHNGINNLYIANWIDGPGFNLPGGAAGPDLALDGSRERSLFETEQFTLEQTFGNTGAIQLHHRFVAS